MATKVTILGEEPKEKKDLKPIEFVRYVNERITSAEVLGTSTTPSEFSHIELVMKAATEDYYDVLFAYNSEDGRSDGCLYLGHFNDGVVE